MSNNALTRYIPTSTGDIDLVTVRHNRKRYPRVADTPEAEALQVLGGLIQTVLMLRSESLDAAPQAYTASAVLDFIKRDPAFHDIAWVEVAQAFKNGALEAYGPFYKTSAAKLIWALRMWRESPEVVDAVSTAQAQARRPHATDAIPDTAIEALVGHFTDY